MTPFISVRSIYEVNVYTDNYETILAKILSNKSSGGMDHVSRNNETE